MTTHIATATVNVVPDLSALEGFTTTINKAIAKAYRDAADKLDPPVKPERFVLVMDREGDLGVLDRETGLHCPDTDADATRDDLIRVRQAQSPDAASPWCGVNVYGPLTEVAE